MKTARQQALSYFYPVLMRISRFFQRDRAIRFNRKHVQPLVPVTRIPVVLNNGNFLLLDAWRDKKILIVNTASDCGYTQQYEDLQQLYEAQGHRVRILACPANDFGEQERGSDQQILQFCRDNFGVSFPLAKKTSVVPGPHQHPLFHWLSNASENGWNNHPPRWNFCKYLLDERGVLTHCFDAAVSPLDKELIRAIER